MMAYCDYIAYRIQEGLRGDTENLLGNVQPTKMDLSPEGYFVSPKKTINITDKFGKKYVVTVEEADV